MNARETLAGACFVLACWYWFLITHELGHAIPAWISGHGPVHISIPLLGFSNTHLPSYPRPPAVVWGGFAGGIVLPLLVCQLLWASFRWLKSVEAMKALCGASLVANGGYLLSGAFAPMGDTSELLQHGIPWGLFVIYGVTATSAGFAIWHHQDLPRRLPHMLSTEARLIFALFVTAVAVIGLISVI